MKKMMDTVDGKTTCSPWDVKKKPRNLWDNFFYQLVQDFFSINSITIENAGLLRIACRNDIMSNPIFIQDFEQRAETFFVSEMLLKN